jgi:L-proline amide hydrolase
MVDNPVPTKEGYATFQHPSLQADKEYRTWYKLLGDFTGRRPLVLLHGGPGAGHKGATRCFDAYPGMTGTPIVYYDQLGCGSSTRLPEKNGDESFWTPALFVAELDNLVRHLGIRDSFDLYGHSWGAKLAAKYAVSEEQKGSGLHKIILSSGTVNQKDLILSIKKDIEAMPQETQDLIHTCIAEGREEEYEYQLALWEFLKKRISTNLPRPDPGQNVMAPFIQDDVVYSTMLGKDPFHVDQGSLRSKFLCELHTRVRLNRMLTVEMTAFDMTEECKAIKQPVLLLNGELEEAYLVQPFFDGIPKVKWFVFSGSAHAASADQPEKYRTVVWNFLKT